MLDHLSEEFEFFVITRDTDYMETKPYFQVVSNQWNTMENGAKVFYVSAGELSFRTLIRVSRQVPFDAVLVNGIYSLYFSLFPLIWFGRLTRKKVIVSARGMLSDQTFSAKKSRKKLFFFAARVLGLYKGVTIHATNAGEEQEIRGNTGFRGDIRIAPNFPPYHENLSFSSIHKSEKEIRLVSIARISPEKNTLFALEILKQFSNYLSSSEAMEQYSLTFDLYGSVYLDEYAEQCVKVTERMPSQVQIRFCGPIEKNAVAETLKSYHFFFMPSLGENYGHSIVESFLAGRPVIISDRTPWKELESNGNGHSFSESRKPNTDHQKSFGIGWDIPLEDTEKYIEVMEYCLAMKQEEFDVMAKRAYAFGQQVVNDPSVKEANRRLFE